MSRPKKILQKKIGRSMFLTYLLIDVGVPKSLRLRTFKFSENFFATFWSPTTKIFL